MGPSPSAQAARPAGNGIGYFLARAILRAMVPASMLFALCLAGGAPSVPVESEFLRLTDALEAAEAQGAPGMMDRRGGPTAQTANGGFGTRWMPGQSLMQGYLGVLMLEEAERSSGSLPPVDGAEDDLARVVTLGGGAMYKLGGNRLDWGLEGMVAFSGRAGATAFYAGGGGAVIAVDIDLLVFDLYGGPFVSLFLGDRLRVYGAAGGLLEWASYDQSGASAADSGDGTGFGSGYYVRTGAEIVLSPATLLGFGVRWSESRIDLSGDLGHLDLAGTQAVVTISHWL